MSCLADLFYGIGLHMPWQYKTVSCCWVGYLSVQHYQLRQYFKNAVHWGIITLMLAGMFALLFLLQYKNIFLTFGYLSQATAFTCVLPQVLKNIGTSAALSLSIARLSLDWFSKLCDNVSAYALAWPLPSKLGAAFSIAMCMVLMYQWIRSRQRINFCSADKVVLS